MLRNVISSLAVAVLALVFLAGQAPAGTTWDAGGGADNNFNTATNWNPDGVPVLNGTSDLVFGTGGSSARVNTPVDVDKITFNRAGSFQLLHQLSTSGSLTIRAGGVAASATSGSRAYSIKENVTAIGAQTWVTNQFSSLTIDNDSINTGLAALTVTLSGGDLTLQTFDNNANAITFIAGTAITGNAGLNVIGRVFLNNTTTDSYTGNTTIGTIGNVTIGSADALPFGTGKGNVVMDNNSDVTNDAGVLNLGGANLQINGLSGAAASGTNQPARVFNNVATGSTAQTLTVGNNDATATFNGIIIDNTANSRKLALTKVGAGTQTLAGANTYTGATTISGGTLQIGNGSTTGKLSASSAITDNANLTINRSNAVAQGTDFSSSAITGTGSLTQAGGGTTTLNVANTFSGDTKVSGGTLTLANSLALQNSTLDYNTYGGSLSFGTLTAATLGGLKGNQNLALTNGSAANVALTTGNNNGNATYSGALSGGGSLTKVGTGIATLTGNSSFGGNTTISGGALSLGDGVATSGSITGTIIDNASLIFNRPDAVTHAGLISGNASGSVTKSAGNTLTLTNANAYGGGTTVSAGTLLANNASGSATGTGGVSVSSGATLGGTGAVSGAVTVNAGGTLSPGASIESLGTGSLTFGAGAASGSTLKFEIGPGITADLVNAVAGSLTIADPSSTVGATLSLIDAGAPTFNPAGMKYTVIAYNGTWNGKTFGNTLPIVVNGPMFITMGSTKFRIRYDDATPGGNFLAETNNNISNGPIGPGVTGATRFVTLTVVPEFSSFITMGLVGCCAIGAVRFGKRLGISVLWF